MASKTYKKSRRLAMLPDDIKKLIEETPRKIRPNVKSPQLEQALQEKRIFDIEVKKAGATSLMTE